MLSDIDGIFLDSTFRIFASGNSTSLAEFDVSLVSPGTKTYVFPDKSGTLAMLSDITTVFLDSVFAIQNDPTSSKEAVFDASLISLSTIRTYSFQDSSSVLLLISDVTGIMVDILFRIQNIGDITKQVAFDASTITPGVTQEYFFPSTPGTLALGSDVGGPVVDNVFRIEYNLASTALAAFDSSVILAGNTRTFTFQNKDGILAMLSDVSGGIFLDSELLIQAVANITKQASFNASSIGSGVTHTYTFPDRNGFLVFSSGSQTLTDKTITGSTNIVHASGLQTTGASVTLSDVPPLFGQVITAITPTTASWQAPPGGDLSFNAHLSTPQTVINNVPTIVIFDDVISNGGQQSVWTL